MEREEEGVKKSRQKVKMEINEEAEKERGR